MNIIRISLATLVLSLGFGLVSCEKAPKGDTAAPASDAPAAPATPATPAEDAKPK